VELVGVPNGDYSIPKNIILHALEKGKHVVTANKALLARNGRELFRASQNYNRNLYMDASVCGEIPIITPLRTLQGSRDISSLEGIVNGTTNYILTLMEQGMDYKVALRKAQDLGFAEADPSSDVEGKDARNKLAILSTLAFGKYVYGPKIPTGGITKIKAIDIEAAKRFGYRIKLMALARQDDGVLEARVTPMLLPQNHVLQCADNENNAIAVYYREEGRSVPYLQLGKGAGAIPTARAIFRDLVDVAKKSMHGELDIPAGYLSEQTATIKYVGRIEQPFYLRFMVQDESGALAKITNFLSDFTGVSFSEIIQPESKPGEFVPIFFTTHEVSTRKLLRTVGVIHTLQSTQSAQLVKEAIAIPIYK